MKVPYTTNQVYISLNDATEVISQIQVIQNKYQVYHDGCPSYLIPYVMVQPKLKNKMEFKVVVLVVVFNNNTKL